MLYNLARVTTATTGTGTITLGAAVPSFLTLAQAGIQDGDVVSYAIEDANGGREVGSGIYTASGTTLTRNVRRSTGAGNTAAISLSGSAQVFLTPAAEDLIEILRTNMVRNNSMQGAISGSPGTLPTNWSIINTFGALTRTVVGRGTENGIDYIDIRWNGTTNTTNATLGWGLISHIPAIAGELWASSAFLSLVGGSLTNINNVSVGWYTFTSGSVFLGSQATVIVPDATQRRFSHVAAVSGATTAFIWPRLAFSWSSGVAVDFTIRIGWPQAEKINNATFSYASPPIRTVDGAISRLDGGILSPYTYQQSADLADLVASLSDVSGSTGTGNLVLSDAPVIAGVTITGVPIISSGAPQLRFLETDEVLPAGLFRFVGSAGSLFLQRNTAVAGDFSTVSNVVVVDGSSNINLAGNLVVGNPANSTITFGSAGQGLLQQSSSRVLYDATVSGAGEHEWRTNSGAGQTARLTIINNGNVRIGTGLLQFLGTSAAFPALKRNGTSLQVRLADDSGFGSLDTLSLTGITSFSGQLEGNYNSAPAPVNPLPGVRVHAADGVTGGYMVDAYLGIPLIFGRVAGGTGASPAATPDNQILLQTGGRGYDGSAYSGDRAFMRFATAQLWSSVAQGTKIDFGTTPLGSVTVATIARFHPSGGISLGGLTDPGSTNVYVGGILKVAGVTSAFPALKRSGTTLQVRLADDSAYGTIDALDVLDRGAAPTGTAGSGYVRATGPVINNSLTLSGVAPTLIFSENDQVLPAGLFRFTMGSGSLFLQQNTAVAGDFSTINNTIVIDGNSNVSVLAGSFVVGNSGSTTGRFVGAGAWADMSSSIGGRALYGQNVRLNGPDNAFVYINTHGSIGAGGLALNYPSINKASIVGTTTPATAGATFTPTTIVTFDYGGNVAFFGLVQFAGTTSAFPALKRNGAVLQVRLADDSAMAPISAQTTRTTAYTVATLPAAGNVGTRACVTDATSTTFMATVVGGGANVVPVFDNGTVWKIG